MSFFSRIESLIAVDVGANSLKLMELNVNKDVPELVNIAKSEFEEDIFKNNIINDTQKVSDTLSLILESNGIEAKRVVTAMPGPSVFTKKIKVPKMDLNDLDSNIRFEAGSFIPHNVNDVHLDFHILGSTGKNQLEVLVVAVKNEIIDSFLEVFELTGLEVAIVDVDSFALQNTFELGYPELVEKTVALIHMGGRYSTINICRGGQSLFTGDISVGGKQVSEAIHEEFDISRKDAEKMKRKGDKDLQPLLEQSIDSMTSEINRQLSFFWSASGEEQPIDSIFVTGGGSLLPGWVEGLKEKTDIDCARLDSFRGIACGEGFDSAYLDELNIFMPLCVGMGIRQPGDKEIPDYD